MNARGDLADTSLHAGLIAQIGDVLATFTDDYASIFSANKCAKGESVLTSRGRGTREVRGNWKAGGKVSDHRWIDQEDDKHTGFTGNLAVLGIGGHGERRGRDGGGEEGRRGEGGGGCEEIRMADGQQDTTQRGPAAWRTFAPFWVAAAKFLTQRSTGSSQAGGAKLYVDEVFDLAHWHYP